MYGRTKMFSNSYHLVKVNILQQKYGVIKMHLKKKK